MQLQPEVYKATDGKWNFRISRIREESWSVIRWPVDQTYIPPRAEILTIDGWRSLLGAGPETRYYTDAEVAQIGTGAIELPS